ncbi:CD3324 family protein [Gorillibacterium sp. sgz500922]|uniref:CD3324 family protein n=1 Tax=Gorillibacterium sp. sgz500922 TaxID=3446694 RepID=UPI003F67EE8E
MSKFSKAGEVLPPHLVAEVQKYMDGGLLYIPEASGGRRPWGAKSGARQELRLRNERMRRDFGSGTATIGELSDRYGLAFDSVKKIVYTQ